MGVCFWGDAKLGGVCCEVVRRRRIVIPNKHGENLVGILHETGSKEVVVVCHGFRSSKVGCYPPFYLLVVSKLMAIAFD